MSRNAALCLLVMLILALAAPGGLAQRGATTPSRSIDEIRADVESKLDLGNAYIADTAMTMAADYPGVYNMNQVSQIYSIMARGGWYYFSDPTGPESYQNANLSLQKGKIKNTIGMGDCDDFAILMTSLVQSIGGSARVIFAYDDDNQSGHAYSELYLGKNGTAEVDEIINWLKSEYNVMDLPGINYTGDEVWLNLDWGSDVTKAAYPGGTYFGEGNRNVGRYVIWQPLPDQMVSPIIVPVIDSMDSTYGWKIIDDGKGSSLSISTTPGKKGNALQLSYDLKEGGFVGISKEVNSSLLSEVAGLNFSYLMIEKKNTINLRLIYDDGTAFGVSWNKPKTDIWSSQKALYSSYSCLSPSEKCLFYKNALEINNIKRIEFIISNNPDNDDIAGSGIVILNHLQGTMAIPAGSPWARSEEKRKQSLAIDLATKADRLAGTGDIQTLKALIAAEALRLYPCWQTDRVIRSALDLLPRNEGLIEIINEEKNAASIALSPDGTRMAVISKYYQDNNAADNNHTAARLWDVTHGIELAKLSHDDHVNFVTFSPDGKRIATASKDKTARLWDAETGRELARMYHQDGVNCVAFSPDGKILATGEGEDLSPRGAARLWDVQTGQELARMDHDAKVFSVIFSRDGKRLASNSYDWNSASSEKARIWNVESGKEILTMEYEGIVDFSADGSKLVTISQEDKDGAVRIRDATTGAELVKIDDEVSINSPRALSPDGSRLAIVDTSKEAHVWDLESRHKLFGISHNDGIGSICFSPDGSRLFTSNLDGTVSIWDARYGRELVRMMLGKREYFTWTLTVSLDGTKLATESSSGIRVWDLGAIRKPTTMEQGFKVSDIAVSPDGSKMAIVGSRLAKVWDIKANRELISREIQAASVLSVAFSPDGSKLAIGTMWSGVDLLDAASGVELAKISLECPEEERDYCEHIGPDFSYDSVAFSPDGTKLAIASSDKTARIWDLVSSKEQARLKHEGSVNSVSFSPNGSILATASADGKARLWDVVSGTMLAEARLKGSAKAIDYSPDGSKIAVASDNESVSIWDSSLTRQLIQIWQEGSVGTLAFSNDGLYLATGSDDKTARVWDIESGKEIARIEHDGAVRSVDFSPDEAELASASDDGMIRISLWRPEDMIADACCRLSRNLTLEEWRQYMGDEPYANTCENNSCISSSNRKPELANTSSRNLSLIRRSILETKKRLMSVPELSSPKRQPELANTSSRNSSLIRSSILDTKKRLMLVPGLLRQ